MKYFEIVDAPELKYAPQLMNWYGKFDVRDIRLESYPNLPERQLFVVEPSERNMFTDVILYPFLLISPKVKEVIEMYRERCYYRDIILLDQGKGKSEMYYLPVFNETEKLQVVEKTYKNGICVSDVPDSCGEKVSVNKNIFWVRDAKKRHTIISLDMAESLLRREVSGLGIKEIELYRTSEDK